MRHTAKILAAAAVTALPALANAAFFAIGTSATVAPTANPSITLAAGASTTLYIWGRATNTGFLNSWSVNVESIGAGLTGGSAALIPAIKSALPSGAGQAIENAAPTARIGFGTAQNLGGTVGVLSGPASYGVTNALVALAAVQITVPGGATPGAQTQLFLVRGSTGFTESVSTGTGHALGFGTNTVNGLAGVDGVGVSSTGATLNPGTSGGMAYTTGVGVRSFTADATIVVETPVVNDFIDITAGGTAAADTVVNGSFAGGYALTPVAGASGNTGSADAVFGNGNPGQVIAAFNLEGESGAILGLIPVAGSPFASTLVGYEYYKTFAAGTPGAAGSFTYNIAWDLPTGVSVSGLAVIPEPSALGLLAAAVPALARRRRA
jgi:hypothetical protein